ncbi:FAD:protein FMN transferase [Frigidibacter sp. MR17.14]|uniref:FAD:protein FMN transferase n=1 Tax=Frigidibacter sp. MR17.14 TaxID=3126509 RepID=UPI00301304EC
MIGRRRFLQISAAALAARPGQAAAAEWQGMAFGAPARITLSGPRAQAEAALAGVAARIAGIEGLCSLQRPASALSRLNASGACAGADPLLIGVLALAGQIHAATGGLFDPTVQPLWQALARGEDPTPARAAVGWDRVRIDAQAGAVRLAPGQALTLNGIAQGWAADLIRADLAAAGFTRALVDMGEVASLGGPFRLGLGDPDLGTFGTVTLTGTALATSSPGALWLGPGQGHILGPRGEPALWSTVTVEADSAALADAASTALCLAPREAVPAIAARLAAQDGRLRRIVAVTQEREVETLFTLG